LQKRSLGALPLAFGEGGDVSLLGIPLGLGLALGEGTAMRLLRMSLRLGLTFGEGADVRLLGMDLVSDSPSANVPT
jgi:hypothetical protein